MLLIILKITVYLMILIMQVHLQKVIPTEADPDTTLEYDCFNVNPTWVNTNEISESNCINDNNEGLLTNDQAVAVSSLPKNTALDSYYSNDLADTLSKTKPNVSNSWMNNLPVVTIPKSNKQSDRKLKTLKTEEIKTDVESNSSKHLQTKDKVSATPKYPTKPIPKPAREAQRKSSPAKRINLPLIELSNPLKKTINNHPDTKNTTHNTKIAPLNHTTPIDLSSFVLLDGDECQMKEITAKVIPAATPPSNQHHPFRYYPKNRPPRVRQPRKPRQSMYPGIQ